MLRVTTHTIKLLSDLTTPVSVFLKLREHFPEILLLESSDYSSREDSQSFICCAPLLTLTGDESGYTFENHTTNTKTVDFADDAVSAVEKVLSQIKTGSTTDAENRFSGIFGYTGFDTVGEFENLVFNKEKSGYGIPTLRYDFFRYIVVFDHFFEELHLVEHCPEGEEASPGRILSIISRQDHQTHGFSITGEEEQNMSADHYMDLVNQAKSHCARGDVFQMVLSRRFSRPFKGDEFNVYRALRSVNPSPYLFYFDYSDFRIFGSSPEAQMVVSADHAEIHPIAGTFRRTGDDRQDQLLADKLLDDPKENAEHIMLVDLARNDLSKNCREVKVASYREVQFFSHVIHLVSRVTGKLKEGVAAYRVFADTFPAGTLSGAPKHKALQLIDRMEPTRRSFYGGGIGMIHLNGDLNHAIIIRSFLSKNQRLYYQAGAGIVIDSVPQNELQEVGNKLAALNKALLAAENL